MARTRHRLTALLGAVAILSADLLAATRPVIAIEGLEGAAVAADREGRNAPVYFREVLPVDVAPSHGGALPLEPDPTLGRGPDGAPATPPAVPTELPAARTEHTRTIANPDEVRPAADRHEPTGRVVPAPSRPEVGDARVVGPDLDRPVAGGVVPVVPGWYGLPCSAVEVSWPETNGADVAARDWLITQLSGQSPESARKTLMYLGLIEEGDWAQLSLYLGLDAATLASVMSGPGSVSAGIRFGAARGWWGATAVADSTASVRLYRAMSTAEWDDLAATGSLRASQSSMGGKWFAETREAAELWAARFYPDGKFVVAELEAPAASLSLRHPRLDGIGPASYVDAADLEAFNAVMRILGGSGR